MIRIHPDNLLAGFIWISVSIPSTDWTLA